MKFQITMKSPDCVYDAIEEAAEDAAHQVKGLDDDEREELIKMKREKLGGFISRWVKYGEYITVEFDTEAKTAIVKEV